MRKIIIFLMVLFLLNGCVYKKTDIKPAVKRVKTPLGAVEVLNMAFFPSKYITPMDITGLTKKEIVKLMEETNANVKLSEMNFPSGGINTATHFGYNADMTAGLSTKVTWDQVLEAIMLSRGITLTELDYINEGTEPIQTALNNRCIASAVITDTAIIVGDGGARGVKETNVLIDSSDNVTGATSYSTDKVSGVPGRFGAHEGNSTDIFLTGNEGAANISASLWFKYSNDEPTANGIMLHGVPAAGVSQRSWGYFDGITIEISAGTIQLMDTAVTPGAYTNADITIDQQGRITLAANGTSAAATEQAGDPAYTDMTTGEWLVATGSGDVFYKSATGMYTIPGTYAADPASCATSAEACTGDQDSAINIHQYSAWKYVATKFTSSGTTAWCEVDLMLQKVGTPIYGLTARIYDNNTTPDPDEPGSPQGTASATVTEGVIGTGYGLINFGAPFDSGTFVDATTYWLVTISDGTGDHDPNYYNWARELTGCSTEGIFYSIDGINWTDNSQFNACEFQGYEP